MRLSLGNKKFATQLNQTNDLLELARSSFSQLKNTHPNNIQFEELFNKARRKKNQNANIIDARDNIVIKKYKKNKRKQFKKRFDNFDTITLEKKLSFLLKKPRDIKRDEHIKELYRIIIKKHSKAKAGILACEKAKNLYLYDTKDVNSLRIARRFCKKNKEFKILEDIERKNDSIKKTFWSKIGLFDILLKRFNKDSVGSYNEMKTILDSSYLLKSNPIHYFELETRKFKLYLIKDPIEALNQLKEIGISINGISSSHYINRYNILCVRYFKKIGETENALKILNIAMNEETKEPQDLFFKLIYTINKEKKTSNTTHFEKLNKIRTKIISNNL
ncbi:hypothetical protein [Flavobacterium sp.]|uniref:hypothetical protein n=1 Tax=Flavobacterium sp. TaxID=239 RepID=UPI00404895E1